MQDKETLLFLEKLGISKQDIIEYIKAMIDERVNAIENKIHDAPENQKESEYKSWYPYNLDTSAVTNAFVLDNLGIDDKELHRDWEKHGRNYVTLSSAIISYMTEYFHNGKQDVSVRIKSTGEVYPLELNLRSVLVLGWGTSYVAGKMYGMGNWLVPVEEEGSDRTRWLQENITETCGISVKVTRAIAGSDDPEVLQITNWLNSAEGGYMLEEMEEWYNGRHNKKKAYNGRIVTITKTRDGALVELLELP